VYDKVNTAYVVNTTQASQAVKSMSSANTASVFGSGVDMTTAVVSQAAGGPVKLEVQYASEADFTAAKTAFLGDTDKQCTLATALGLCTKAGLHCTKDAKYCPNFYTAGFDAGRRRLEAAEEVRRLASKKAAISFTKKTQAQATAAAQATVAAAAAASSSAVAAATTAGKTNPLGAVGLSVVTAAALTLLQ
jgi:hypothetical protein